MHWRKTNQSPRLADEIHAAFQSCGEECRVILTGRVTIDSSPELRTALMERLQSTGCKALVADFFGVDYIDTSGLAILVEILKLARAQGKTLSLSGLREKPRYLLEATGLLHLFDDVDRRGQLLNESIKDGVL